MTNFKKLNEDFIYFKFDPEIFTLNLSEVNFPHFTDFSKFVTQMNEFFVLLQPGQGVVRGQSCDLISQGPL